MKMPFFASTIVFVIWLAYEIKKVKKEEQKQTQGFWDRENEANNTRRKSLADLVYILIPTELLEVPENASEYLLERIETLKILSTSKIVNLTGMTNTDLKLKYGAPNLPLLTQYDQSYVTLARTLQEAAVDLFKSGNIEKAKAYLEFAVDTNTDVSQSYYLLADIYEKLGEPDEISKLETRATELNSIMKNSILENLADIGPHSEILRNPN